MIEAIAGSGEMIEGLSIVTQGEIEQDEDINLEEVEVDVDIDIDDEESEAVPEKVVKPSGGKSDPCLLYTSDAADE